jgi:capsular polysaccharide biosynthesis protein
VQLRDYWRLLRKWWWLIGVVAMVAATTAFVYSRSQERIYRSTALLLVSPSRFDYGLTLVIQNLMRQYSRQLDTDELAETVSDRLQLDLSADRLRAKVKVSPVEEDFLLQIDVYDPDPNRAKDIAFVLADEFVKEQQIRMAPVDPRDRIDVTLLNRPKPGLLDRPKTMPNVLAGSLLGLLMGVLLVFVLEFTDDTLKSAEDIERHVQLPTLGAIPASTMHGGRGAVAATAQNRGSP